MKEEVGGNLSVIYDQRHVGVSCGGGGVSRGGVNYAGI